MLKNIIATVVIVWAGAVRAEPVTIAALGDSLTQGYGLVQQDGFVPQLQDWLAERGAEARIINAGVSGDTAAGGAARVAWTLAGDVDAMIVALGGNDLLRGIAPEVTRGHIETILREAAARQVEVLLIGMQAPGNYGPEYKAEFDAIYPELAEEYGALHLESFFEGFGDAARDPAAARPLMQADGIHPNAEGVERIVTAVGPKVLELVGRAD